MHSQSFIHSHCCKPNARDWKNGKIKDEEQTNFSLFIFWIAEKKDLWRLAHFILICPSGCFYAQMGLCMWHQFAVLIGLSHTHIHRKKHPHEILNGLLSVAQVHWICSDRIHISRFKFAIHFNHCQFSDVFQLNIFFWFRFFLITLCLYVRFFALSVFLFFDQFCDVDDFTTCGGHQKIKWSNTLTQKTNVKCSQRLGWFFILCPFRFKFFSWFPSTSCKFKRMIPLCMLEFEFCKRK